MIINYQIIIFAYYSVEDYQLIWIMKIIVEKAKCLFLRAMGLKFLVWSLLLWSRKIHIIILGYGFPMKRSRLKVESVSFNIQRRI